MTVHRYGAIGSTVQPSQRSQWGGALIAAAATLLLLLLLASPAHTAAVESPSSASSERLTVHPTRVLGDLSSFTAAERDEIRLNEARHTADPNNIEVMIQLIQAYLSYEQHTPTAKALIDRCVEIAPNHPGVLAALGDYYRLYGAYSQSAAYYARSLAANPITSTSGAEFRMNYAGVLYSHGLKLIDDRQEFAAKSAFETCQALLNEAMLMHVHPDFRPRITSHQWGVKEERFKKGKRIDPTDPTYILHESIHYTKTLLAETWMQLFRLHESQAFFYLQKLDTEAQFAPWKSSDASAIAGVSESVRRDYDSIQDHLLHLHSMSLEYVRRVLKTIVPTYIDDAHSDDRDRLSGILSQARRFEHLLNETYVFPLQARVLAFGSDPAGAALQQAFEKHQQRAVKLVQKLQLVHPLPPALTAMKETKKVREQKDTMIRELYWRQHLLASVLHANCKYQEAASVVQYLYVPTRSDDDDDADGDVGVKKSRRPKKRHDTTLNLPPLTSNELLQSALQPFLHTSRSSIIAARRRWTKRIDQILEELQGTADHGITQQHRWTQPTEVERSKYPYYAAFHGEPNMEDMQKLGAFHHLMAVPPKSFESWLDFTAEHLQSAGGDVNGLDVRRSSSAPRRIKVAFVSSYLFDHGVGRWMLGYVDQLDRSKFEVTIYWMKPTPKVEEELTQDEIYQGFRRAIKLKPKTDPKANYEKIDSNKYDSWIEIPRDNYFLARQVIGLARQDVLIYSDLHLESTSYYLAFSRLAPIQATTLWGHADTSGLPNIDYVYLPSGAVQRNSNSLEKQFSEFVWGAPDIGYHKMPDFTAHLQVDKETQTESTPADGTKTTSTHVTYRPRQSRADFHLSDRQLRDVFKLDLPALPVAADGVDTDRATTIYLVAKEAPFYSPPFMRALGRILASQPNSILLLMVEPGTIASSHMVADADGLSGAKVIRGGLKNRCAELILDGVEDARYRAINQSVTPRRSPALNSDLQPKPDYLASLTSTISSYFTPATHADRRQTGRVRFIGRIPDRSEWLNLLENVDVLLQPFPMDGALTAIDAIQVHLPTVFASFSTTVGGRLTHAVYDHLDLADQLGATSIDDYVNRAVQLGTNRTHHSEVRQLLENNKRRIYEDRSAITHFEEWIEIAVEKRVNKMIDAQAKKAQQTTTEATAQPKTDKDGHDEL